MLALIPLFPFIGFIINALIGRRLSKATSGGLACLAMLVSFGVAVVAFWRLLGLPAEARVIDETLFTWIASGRFQAPLTFRLDPLAGLMCLVVTGIGFLIHVYSTAYMHEETDHEYARYFSYLNLFAAFMLVLVLGANLLVMFIGWEGVGLCSYLLIGYWFDKQSATDAGKKAFVVNRVGDMAFIVGMCLAFASFGTLDFRAIAAAVAALPPEVTWGVLSTITLLFFIGATGKSAQIPLYIWLPDAMEGPTPVSALIHAATMVTAGVYMIGRNAVLYSHAPLTMEVVAVIGVATALLAGTIGLAQNDIKRVLAYSTVSQLGYMFLAMGVGAFAAGIFHLYTHAFFKALMFLGSGAVIHALHGEQDMRKMGGLRRALPITYWTFLIGALAIAGVPGLSGFFSKDEILFRTFASGHSVLWVLGTATALLTAVYMFRLIYLTFHGKPRYEGAYEGAQEAHRAHDRAAHAQGTHNHGGGGVLHDAPMAMAIPLVLLAIGSVVAGYVGVPHALGGSNRIETFLEPSFSPPAHTAPAVAGTHAEPGVALSGEGAHAEADAHGATHADTALELTLMVTSVAIALMGIGIATLVWLKRPHVAAALAARVPWMHRLLLNKWYVDELYDATIVQPIKNSSTVGLWKGVDVGVIDGAVNGTGWLVRGSAAGLRLAQSGSVRIYAAAFFVGTVLVIAFYLVR
ncbi:MAG: NADH-quinone oxidoreductase subunit L [Luteitalea sp.]|nr:NADH-quinone oxidoreductase subunit L [Luteitalea sp.]